MLLTMIDGESDKAKLKGEEPRQQQHPHSPNSFTTMPTTVEAARHQRRAEDNNSTAETEGDTADVPRPNSGRGRPEEEEEDTEAVLDLTVVSDGKSGSATLPHTDRHGLDDGEEKMDGSGHHRISAALGRNGSYFSMLRHRHGNSTRHHGRCEEAGEDLQMSRHTTSFMMDDILNPNKFRGGPAVCGGGQLRPGSRHHAERRLQGADRLDSGLSMEVSGNRCSCSVFHGSVR